MFRVFANNPYNAFSSDDLALRADLLHGWPNLHLKPPSLVSVNYPSPLNAIGG